MNQERKIYLHEIYNGLSLVMVLFDRVMSNAYEPNEELLNQYPNFFKGYKSLFDQYPEIEEKYNKLNDLLYDLYSDISMKRVTESE